MVRKSFQIALVIMFVCCGAFAATNRIGTAGAQELRIPIGARGTAMTGAIVADVGGAEALFWNPAGSAWQKGTDAMVSYRAYIADMNLSYFGVVSSFASGNIGVSAKILSVGDIYVTRTDAWEGTGEVYSVNIPVLGFSYSRMLTDRVAFGATAMYISEQVMQTRATGMAFDFGFQYVPGWKTLRLGMVMKNYGPKMQFGGADFERPLLDPDDDPQAAVRQWRLTSADFELPSSFQIGATYDFDLGPNGIVRIGGVFQSNDFSEDEYRLGVEYNMNENLFLRGGYVYCNQERYLYGPSIGVGAKFTFGRVKGSLDYSHTFVDSYFDDIPEISLRFTL